MDPVDAGIRRDAIERAVGIDRASSGTAIIAAFIAP